MASLPSKQDVIDNLNTFYGVNRYTDFDKIPFEELALSILIHLNSNSSGGGGIVGDSVSVSNFPSNQTISGNVSVNNFPETQAVVGVVSVSNLPTTQPVNGTVNIGNFPSTQAVSGNISITNLPENQTVNGTVNIGNFPTTQPVSASSLPLPTGAATETTLSNLLTKLPTNLSGGRLSVDGSGVTQPVSGSVTVSNFPNTQPVSLVSLPSLPAGNNSIGSVTVSNFPNNQSVSVTALPSIPLPTNAATETTLLNLVGKLPSELSSGGRLIVDGSGVTQPVTASSLPLPTGAATETTSNNIKNRLPPNLGSNVVANSLPVTLATDGIFAVAFGARNDVQATSDTADTGYISLFKRFLTKLTSYFQGVAGSPNNNVITVQGHTSGIPQNVDQSRNLVSATITFPAGTTSNTFTIDNRLAIIFCPPITGAPTLTLQVSFDGTNWANTSVALLADASNWKLIEADSLAKVSGAFGLTNAFRFISSVSITAVTLRVRSITK